MTRTAERTGTEIVLTGLGGTEVVTTRTTTRGEPGKHGLLVRTEAAGVAFAEVQMLRGRYPAQPAFPFVPGYDLVGEVVAVGEAVTSCRVGQRVAAMPRTGAWADYVEVRDSDVVPVPDEIDAAEAVAVVLNGVTAWQLLHRAARVRSGQTVLVHGAGGGVGALLAQLGALSGVRVIGTASAGRHEVLRPLGAELIDHRTEDVAARVRELAPRGVDAVFDPLGEASLRRSWELLAPGGALVAYGSSATLTDDSPWWRPYLGMLGLIGRWELLRLVGRTAGRRARMYYVRTNREYRKDLTELLRLVACGRLRPLVGMRLPLSQAAEALDTHMAGRVTGRIVLVTDHVRESR
ncbi:NADPH2:quinone reductase [Saccharopolyspora erythraea NRRL 2338]|uniref:NADPH:quinone reductase or related Zn-dependent oxidoreductase n=2 Tax=Saccharopolyspora erythraea TaxID=1836 RepID=A4FP32_SACEN|nr:medium chain dehydrogenase/reductase family protein [Saccharopolyspora erythraea]EQD83440.1 alcohol dehydrogenase [Saccharopolyspora erythraea D]PFG99448.1 NADPH2:quinone reductase [Saccharopolyspora erythraea NRRL 2338]QRK89357.1 zinc-binding dehydrogenase [Saccharopolyspora erythraea]CAM05807.1 NADPH:quinone reductase or related Zn-dependent oxidoreductase [Saccharopolyspora erythraea NRRL 2338]